LNADAFRYLYEYHFRENHTIWEHITGLTPKQFMQEMGYSHHSVRDQIVHLMNVDQGWFSELQNIESSDQFEHAAAADDREIIRAYWDFVEVMMRDYLADLRDDMLFDKPIEIEEDKNLMVWQVLLHVVNHGTDHRAQLLRFLHDLGVKTSSQDFIFYVYDFPND
jgi:uncharacterized damage-inducible protein DinB